MNCSSAIQCYMQFKKIKKISMMASNNHYKRLCTEENNAKGNAVKEKVDQAFTPRDYQIEILEIAKQKNTIACLGTGTGKTFIAVMLIRECANDVHIDFENGGKRIFFLVPTVPLVHQQQRTIENHTSFKVKGYSGDMQVDSWNKEKWTQEFKNNQVLVMTAEIFRIIVDHLFIPLEKIQLIIIDECHRAQGDHPYRQAMKCFMNRKLEEMPRVFGLSASLINGKCKPSQLEKQLRDLEKTLFSSITTVSDIIDLQKYGADPDEFLIYYKPYSIETDLFEKICKMKNIINREKTNYGRGSEYVLDTDIVFFDKPLRCLNSLFVTLKKLGPWCALKAADVFSEELESVLLKNSNGLLTSDQTDILNKLKEFIDIFKKECSALNLKINPENELNWPHKLQRLLELFFAIKNSTKFCDKSKPLSTQVCPNFVDDPEGCFKFLNSKESALKSEVDICAIIFVEQRITAYVLQQWILEIKKDYPELDFLVPEFVVGHGSNGGRRTCMSEKQQKKALEDFRRKKCNILISTCVLEEGMDVQQCNIVIRFDLPADFRGYVQSKGRARAKNSAYVLMSEFNETDNSKFWIDMVNFKTVEKMLLSKCHNRILPEEEEVKEHMADSLMPPYMPYGPNGPRITLISAISVINRYCASLPSDMATKLTAKWYVKTVDPDAPDKQYECTLKMPINSPLRKPIVGERMRQKKAAKMAAALKACQQLNEIGELNEHLVPVSCLVDKAALDEIGELEEEDGDGAIPGTNRRRQVYSKHVPIFLKNSLPKPMVQCYLYALEMDLVEPLPDCLNPRNRPIINPAASERGLAILLTKRLPKINSFPVFTKSGKLKVKICLTGNELEFSATQLDSIAKFHQFVFAKALGLCENKPFEPDAAHISFYIVPTKRGSCSGTLIVDWQFIDDTKNQPYKDFKTSMAVNTIGKQKFFEDLYIDAVLLKTYIKSDKPTFHHTIKVWSNMSPSSMLSDITFRQYYQGKYNIRIQDENQPLVETYQDAILHRWKPIYLSSKMAFNDITSLSKTKQRHKNYKEYLVPELCIIHPFPSTFYQKVLCLPTILFRLNSLLLAEELRRQVATSGLIGTVEPNVLEWPHFNLETSDKELKKYLVEKRKITLVPECTFIPQDIVKQGAVIDSFVKNIDDLSSHPGPSPSLILQALTSKSTGDEFDLERLEMIGDSFLKYAMSIKIYLKYPNFDEGKLTKLRSRLIQNLNLYQLAKKKNLPEFLICSTFSCKKSWLPPCYNIEEKEVKISNKNSKVKQEEGVEQQFTFFKKQIISDKCIADSVEALIGAYLLSCGHKGALMFMFWLGLNPFPEKTDVNRYDFENWPPKPPSTIINNIPNVDKVLRKLCQNFEEFEKSIGYVFKDRALLLQAFTHPSYIYNEITDCYQRLEFLGDAVLDFLITRQLYEDPNDHSPGKLTDLRSALVNNIYFASLAVKYKYNIHLKMLSPHLFRLLQHYLDIYEASSACQFFEKHGFLEEIECFELDEVEVPKALGDLFESVAGAIFLDSGMSLDTVWKVVYPMIKPAMDHLTKHVPVSPVRELYEILKRKDIFNETKKNEKSYVEVILDTGEKVVGVGPNKKVAKRSAAKRALAILKGISE